jgi:hypothetical protein
MDYKFKKAFSKVLFPQAALWHRGRSTDRQECPEPQHRWAKSEQFQAVGYLVAFSISNA